MESLSLLLDTFVASSIKFPQCRLIVNNGRIIGANRRRGNPEISIANGRHYACATRTYIQIRATQKWKRHGHRNVASQTTVVPFLQIDPHTHDKKSYRYQ